MPELCKRYVIKMVNLTERPGKTITLEIDGREVCAELSAEMLEQELELTCWSTKRGTCRRGGVMSFCGKS